MSELAPPAYPPHGGSDYHIVLSWFHRYLRPRSYLEIGTFTGDSLKHATCASVAVDPRFHVTSDIVGAKPKLMLFQMGSDAFFRDTSPRDILGAPVDLVFLDGLHQYEALLRDFINVEKHCRRNSVIVMHDCLPTDLYYARRDPNGMRERAATISSPEWWAGDVWKTVAILKKARPELRIHAFDAPPTGLVCVTNLDPTSTLLEDDYFNLVEPFADPAPDAANFAAYHETVGVRSTREIERAEDMARFFWL
jgi:hypothetical protein